MDGARRSGGRAAWAGAALLATALVAGPARAALGEAEASVAGDRRALAATTPAAGARDAGSYRVHEFTARGATIREYVGADGVVFAVAWSGYSTPQLAPLLGSYYPEYRAAARGAGAAAREAGARAPGRRQARRIEGPRVVVDRWGRMRDWHGRAWLPDRVPAGVDLDAIR